MVNDFALAALVALAAPAQPNVGELAWLAGCWRTTGDGPTVTEFWLPPDGGTMIGLSRTVQDGRTVDYEFLLLRPGQRGLEYVASPSGRRQTVFTSTDVSSDRIVFENPAHDFPTRITYRRTADGVLATIDGVVKGQPRAVEFRYTRADCAK